MPPRLIFKVWTIKGKFLIPWGSTWAVFLQICHNLSFWMKRSGMPQRDALGKESPWATKPWRSWHCAGEGLHWTLFRFSFITRRSFGACSFTFVHVRLLRMAKFNIPYFQSQSPSRLTIKSHTTQKPVNAESLCEKYIFKRNVIFNKLYSLLIR